MPHALQHERIDPDADEQRREGGAKIDSRSGGSSLNPQRQTIPRTAVDALAGLDRTELFCERARAPQSISSLRSRPLSGRARTPSPRSRARFRTPRLGLRQRRAKPSPTISAAAA